jgi:hypothetical protein
MILSGKDKIFKIELIKNVNHFDSARLLFKRNQRSFKLERFVFSWNRVQNNLETNFSELNN